MNEGRGFPWIPAVGLAAVAIYLALTPTGGWDVWWHMQTGRVALEQQSTLATDPFSHSFAGEPWGHKDLLADVILYLGFAGLGFGWFSILKALAVIGIGAALFAYGRRARTPDVLSALFAGLGIVAVQYRLVERPVLFSLALFPALIVLLERLRDVRATDQWRPVLVRVIPAVALIWFWSLLHREALIGIGLLGLEVAGAIASRLLGQGGDRRPSSRFLATSIIGLCGAAALPLVSPSGAAFYTSSLAVGRSDAMRDVITDWARIGPLELLGDFPITAVLVALAAIGAIAAAGRGLDGPGNGQGLRTTRVVALLLLVVALFADCVRWLPYTSTVAACVALRGLGPAVAGRISARLASIRSASAVAVVVVLGGAVWQNDLGTGVGPMEDRYPAGAVEFARENGLEGDVVNAFHLGGYLIWESWPGTRVLIDGRNDVVYPPEFLLRALSSERRADTFRRMREEDGATWVVAGNIPGHESHAFLARAPDWVLVYWSEPALIYLRRDVHSDLDDLAFRHVLPTAVDASVADATRTHRRNPARLEEIGKEVRRMLAASPNSLRALVAAALHLHFAGPAFHPRRDEVLGRLDVLHPEHPAVGQLRERLGLTR